MESTKSKAQDNYVTFMLYYREVSNRIVFWGNFMFSRWVIPKENKIQFSKYGHTLVFCNSSETPTFFTVEAVYILPPSFYCVVHIGEKKRPHYI